MRIRRDNTPPYPVHGYTLGMLGGKREPYTWFDCGHGHQDMGTPWRPPRGGGCKWCEMEALVATAGAVGRGEQQLVEAPATHWAPADPTTATLKTAEALDYKPDLIARAARPR